MKKIMSVIAAVIMLTAGLASCSDPSSTKDSSKAEVSSRKDSSSSEASDTKDSSSEESSGTEEDNGLPVIASGYIGDTADGGKEEDVKWTLYEFEDDQTYYLDIVGKGRMKDFTSDGEGRAPYYKYKSKIGRIRVASGVKNIGEYAFCGCDSALYAFIIDVAQIGKYAFKDCCGLTSVELPVELTKLGDGAFANCTNLKDIYRFYENLTDIGEKVFDGCKKLTLHIRKTGNSGLTIEEYAKQNNIKYEAS